jgi:hypothetical protein
MAQIIKTNGEVIETQPKNGTDFSLEELQAIVEHKANGVSYHYIEIINLRDGRIMVINDEGKLIGCGINHKATDIFSEVFGYHDFVVGNVLLCNDDEVR